MRKFLFCFLLISQVCAAQNKKGKIVSFTLVNAETGQSIGTLTDGSIINLDEVGHKLNIVAKTAPKRLRTVLFELTGAQNHTHTDNKRPHTLFGDDNNNYEQWDPPLGSYTLTASPLLLIGPGPGLTVSFTVVQNSADPPNQPPVANAGPDRWSRLPEDSVILAGSGTDPDGTITNYNWNWVSGPGQYQIVNNASAATLVRNLVQGVYRFELSVTDNGGMTGRDTVNVVVMPSTNQQPVADAGPDIQIRLPEDSVMLKGSGSDSDGNIVGYKWEWISGPGQYEIVNNSGASTLVRNLVQGQYNFRLTVTDDSGLTGSDTVTVTVEAATAKPPTADAGPDKVIQLPQNSVTINGTGSDPDGVIVTYAWSWISGPAEYEIVNNSSASTLIRGLVQGIYQFQLTVTDDAGLSGSDTVMITVNAASPPPPPSDSTVLGGYFASPDGTGDGSYSSPFRIADFWSVAKPGDTLNLMDGHYTGVSSMIDPPENLSGTAGQRIVIRAIHDGKVDIDGQGRLAPVSLGYNNYFTLEGFNAHDAGSPTSFSVSVVSLNYSSYNILRRICAWEATDGNTNIFGVHHGDYNLLEDCAGWGTARKTFSNAQQGNYTIFRRCFGRWEGSHAEGPKKTFGVSYNSYNALLENCIGTWDGLKMKESYELMDYYGNGVGKFYTNYEVQQPDGIFSHDGFDVQPDIANARLFGCIAFLKASQRYHNSFKKWAAPFAFEIKGVVIKDALSYIEPGSYTDIWNVNLASVGNTTTNHVEGLTQIGGELGHISSDWTPVNMNSSPTCGATNTGNVITKRYVDGILTKEDLWPWPMNQRIKDAMAQGGYQPFDVTQEIFGLCGDEPPTVDYVALAKQWLADSSSRPSIEPILNAYKGNIDSIINLARPVPKSTQTGEVFYQSFTNPLFQARWPDHQFHMYIPTHYNPSKPFGLMIWLHGGGSWDQGEIDHLAQYDMDNETFTGRSYPRTETDNSNYILVAPIAPFGSALPHPDHASRWNVPGADQYLMDIITEISTRYNIDYNKIVVAGFSMGGIGAFHQALRLNDRLSAVMASAGNWKLATWDGLKHMPMYIIHGVNDAHYNSTGCRAHFTPIEAARLAHDFLWNSSNIHQLYEYPGEHPWDNSAELYWKNFISGQEGWVTNKVRDPYRDNVTAVNPWRSYDVGSNFGVTWDENPSPHTMWLSINEIGDGVISYDYARVEGTGGCSSLSDFQNWAMYADTKKMPGGKAEATITGPNQITIVTENVKSMSVWLHPKMVDFSKPVTIVINGVTKFFNPTPSLLTALKSYERRWDWSMIYHAEIKVM